MKKLQTFYSNTTNRFKYWLLLVIASAVLVGFSYVAVQQNYRENANDPQVQYVQDLSRALEEGTSPDALGGNSPVNPAKSLGLFLVVMGDNKKVLSSSLEIEGSKDTPVPSNGTFDAAKKGQERFTWQPKKGVRLAAVMQHYGGNQPGYILVGRSLQEVEKREKELALMALASFMAMVALSTVAVRIGAEPRASRAAVKKQAPLAFEPEPKNEISEMALAEEENDTIEASNDDAAAPKETVSTSSKKRSRHHKKSNRS